MEIKLLKQGYKNSEEFYDDFINDSLVNNNKYISDESVYIDDAPDFPIYIYSRDNEKRKQMLEKAIKTIIDSYLKYNSDIYENELFWHSLLCLYKRDYILKNYPVVKRSYKDFKNIVIKHFDWQNYIYKCVLAAKFISKYPTKINHYIGLINDNFDVFNYMLKYPTFRNQNFFINFLDIIDEENVSEKLKSKVTKLKKEKDLRYGRFILSELNNCYPIVLSPMLEKDELKVYFNKFLNYYE